MPATTSVTCPECQSQLRIPAAIPAGKKIRCPKCQVIFVVNPEAEEMVPEVDMRVSVAPKAPARRPPPPGELDDEEDRPLRRKQPRHGRRRPVLLWSTILGRMVVTIGGGVALYLCVALYLYVLKETENPAAKKGVGNQKGVSKPKPRWDPEPGLLDKLGPVAGLQDWRIRPPKGYLMEQRFEFTGPKFLWKGPLRPDRTKPTLAMSIVNLGAVNQSLDQVFKNQLADLKKSWAWYLPHVKIDAAEYGQINGKDFARSHFRLSNASGTIKMQGFVYLTMQGTIAYSFLATGKEQNQQDLKLHEAAVCTFSRPTLRPFPRKP